MVRVSRGTIRNMYTVHGLPESPRKSRKAWLMNNIIMSEKQHTFNHMGENFKMGCLGSRLLNMARWWVSHG
jgi:hypothetical protein